MPQVNSMILLLVVKTISIHEIFPKNFRLVLSFNKRSFT
jgi:hypothetical protein